MAPLTGDLGLYAWLKGSIVSTLYCHKIIWKRQEWQELCLTFCLCTFCMYLSASLAWRMAGIEIHAIIMRFVISL